MLQEMNEEMVERFLELVSDVGLSDEEIIEVSTHFFIQSMCKAQDVFEQLAFYHVFNKYGLIGLLDKSFAEDSKEILCLMDAVDELTIELIRAQEESACANCDECDRHEGYQFESDGPLPENLKKDIVVDCFTEALKTLYGDDVGLDVGEITRHFSELSDTNPEKFEEDQQFISEYMSKNLQDTFSDFSLKVFQIDNPRAHSKLIESLNCLKDLDEEELNPSELSENELKALSDLIQEGKRKYEELELKVERMNDTKVQ